jgi:hypothetical protein
MRFGSIQDAFGNPIGSPIITVLQSNTYSDGQAVYFNGTDWQLANASSGDTLAIGVIKNVTIDGFTVYLAGPITGLSGLSSGQYYFVSDSVAGLLTSTEPTDIGSYSNPILFATSATEGVVLQYRPSAVYASDGYYQTIQNSGVDVPQRAKLNFVGANFSDAPGFTTVNITGSQGSQGTAGTQGTAGAPGTAGSQGAQGAQGTAPTDISCRATNNTAQTITDSPASAVIFDAEEYDTANIHDTVTNNTRFVIPSSGKYVFIANVRFAINSHGVRKIYWMLNGSPITFIGASAPGIVSFQVDLCSTFERSFSASDYVELMAMQTGTTSVDIESAFVTVRKVY